MAVEIGSSQQIKPPHFVTSELLYALGGIEIPVNVGDKTELLVDGGAHLWGAENRKLGDGILNHVLLTSRVAYAVGKKLQERHIAGYENLNLKYVVHAAILHDITKLYGEGRERLTPEEKTYLGLSTSFREIMDEVDDVGVEWLQSFGFPAEVYEAIRGHDFPENIHDNPYWKIVLLADYMTSQSIMPVEERLRDVEQRWIIDRPDNPRIEPERFARAQQNILAVTTEIFGALGVTDVEFIEQNHLNDPATMPRWEKFLRDTFAQGLAQEQNGYRGEHKETQAKRVVGLVERVRDGGKYGRRRFISKEPKNTHWVRSLRKGKEMILHDIHRRFKRR